MKNKLFQYFSLLFIFIFLFQKVSLGQDSKNNGNWQIGINSVLLFKKDQDFHFLAKKISSNNKKAIRLSFDYINYKYDLRPSFERESVQKIKFLGGLEKRNHFDKVIILNGIQLHPSFFLSKTPKGKITFPEESFTKKNYYIYGLGISYFTGIEYNFSENLSLSLEFTALANFEISKAGYLKTKTLINGSIVEENFNIGVDRKDFTFEILPINFLNLNYTF